MFTVPQSEQFLDIREAFQMSRTTLHSLDYTDARVDAILRVVCQVSGFTRSVTRWYRLCFNASRVLHRVLTKTWRRCVCVS